MHSKSRVTPMIAVVALSGAIGLAEETESLPPQVRADRYLLQLDRLIAERDHVNALKLAETLTALQQKHGLALPKSFDYKHAQVALLAGSIDVAQELVSRYVTVIGRDGEFYSDALGMLDRIDDIRSRWDEAPRCREKRYRCWMQLENPLQCFVWSDDNEPNATATWSGRCEGGLGQGTGSLNWALDSNLRARQSGELEYGRKHGHWTEEEVNGTVSEGSYVDGERHGPWTFSEPDDGRENGGRITKTQFARGLRHGPTVISWPIGQTLERNYDAGSITGISVRRFRDGRKVVGNYSKSQREGTWRHYDADGSSRQEMNYSNGELHGRWFRKHDSRCSESGRYVEGSKVGIWQECPYDSIARGAYLDGEENGTWKITSHVMYYDKFGSERWHQEGVLSGTFVAGNKTGVWTYEDTQVSPNLRGLGYCKRKSKTPYVDGVAHGTATVRTLECECRVRTYSNDSRISDRRVGKRTCRRELD